MGGHRLKHWAWFVGVSVCLGAAGCGSTQTVTQMTTVTKTVTRTVVHHAKAPRTKTVTVTTSSAPPIGSGSSYPAAFAPRFKTACANAGVYDPAFCSCALKYIEAHVPFSTVRAQGQATFSDNPPSWFTAASNHCAGK